jgi:hypothetical protein
MRYEVRVDHIAEECLWRTDGRVVCLEMLPVNEELKHRVSVWIDRHIALAGPTANENEEAAFDAWLDFDDEGREIARLLRAALGPGTELSYYSEASEEYERIA